MPRMHLKILLPDQVFADKADVTRMVAETHAGAFGLLPRRRDCIAALVPGILTYETATEGEVFVALDEGVLVKAGADVMVSVRRAISGSDLTQLRAAVEQEFLALDAQQIQVRSVMNKLESGFLNRFARLRNA
jgi:F-type H+-transporting ATPase subunit epsilon